MACGERAKAEAKAREAEARLEKIRQAERDVTTARNKAERMALQAQQTMRDAEQAAAAAEAAA